MTTLIFGVGFGTFIIFTLWLSGGFICLLSLRTHKKLGLTALGLIGIVTLTLFSIPRASQNSSINIDKTNDHFFIWRTLLLILLAASSLVAVIAYIKLELMTPVKAVRVKNWVL